MVLIISQMLPVILAAYPEELLDQAAAGLSDPDDTSAPEPLEVPDETATENEGFFASLLKGVSLFSISMNTKWYEEGKTEFTLTNEKELRGLAELVNNVASPVDFSGVTIRLGSDIALSDGSWTPIGLSETYPFAGTFDGCGHTISGLRVTGEGDNRGLFGVTAAGAEICNLLVEGSVEGASNVAGLIGYAVNTKVENCGINVAVTASGENGAGIIGRADEKSGLHNCFSMGKLSEGCAAVASQGTMTNCYYLSGTATEGFDAAEKDESAFLSGEVAWLLDGGEGERLNLWSQGTQGPVFAGGANGALYRVTAAETETAHGSVSAPLYGKAGVKIPFAVEAEEGYLLKKLTVTFADGSQYVDSGAFPAIEMAQCDGTWTAEFVPQPEEAAFKVTFHANGGTVNGREERTLTVDAGSKARELTPDGADSMVRFDGWYRDEALTERYSFGEAVTENVELYAKWIDLFAAGTEEAPIAISSRTVLAALAQRVNSGNSYAGCYFVLTQDLTLSGSWTPIGTQEHPFSGSFDGGLHTISGLKVTDPETGLGGLFGATDGARIQNLAVKGTVSAAKYAGALIALAKDTMVRNCASYGEVSTESGIAGGLIGHGEGSTSAENCLLHGSVAGGTGSAVGQDVTAKNCYFVSGAAAAQDGAQEAREEALASGEIAWLLNRDGGPIWGQESKAPALSGDSKKTVYRITAQTDGRGTLEPEKEFLKAGETAVVTSVPGTNGGIAYILKLAVVTAGEETLCTDSGEQISFTMPASDVTVSGEFVKKTQEAFTVSFDANGGGFRDGAAEKAVTVKAGEKAEAQTVTRAAEGETNFVFTGWYIDKQCSSLYDFQTGVTENFVLYAGWRDKNTVEVVFDVNGGQGTVESQFRNRGEKIQEPAEPVRDEEGGVAWKFAGWSAQKENGQLWNFAEDTIPQKTGDGTFVLYAQWTQTDRFQNGTEKNPYPISSAAQLKALAAAVNQGSSMEGCYFALTGDISLSGYRTWTSIGSEDAPFSGNFDGCGYTVSGMKQLSGRQLNGLFGKTSGAVISNLTVSGRVEGGAVAGGVAAVAENSAFINCCSQVEILESAIAGGIVGAADGNIAFTDCRNEGTVSGTQRAGGILGVRRALAGARTGNIVSTWTGCFNKGAVTSRQGRAGGITGAAEISSYNEVTVTGCWNTGSVQAKEEAGGVFGTVCGAQTTANTVRAQISECENSGVVSSDAAAGGLIGRIGGETTATPPTMTDLSKSLNTGSVAGKQFAGGLVGQMEMNSSSRYSAVSQSYNTGTVASSEGIAGGILGSNARIDGAAVTAAERISGVYSSGTVTGAMGAGYISGAEKRNASGYSGCYALADSAESALDAAVVTTKTAEELSSAAFAWELDAGRGIWTQGTPGPVFATDAVSAVYHLTIAETKGVTVTGVSADGYYRSGSTVKLTLTPEEGKLVKSWTVTAGGNLVAQGSGNVSFTMPKSDAVLAVECVDKTADKFTITFRGNGGLINGQDSFTVTVAAGETVTAPAADRMSEDGTVYVLAGWYTDEELGNAYVFSQGVCENLELYAKWKVGNAFTVTFDLNAKDETAGGLPEAVATYKGLKLDKPADPTWPDRADETHEFLGWAPVKDAKPEEIWKFDQDLISPLWTGSAMTLYAQWKTQDLFLTGTETDPFEIADAETLTWLARKVNAGVSYENCYFRMAEGQYDLGSDWTPIGLDTAPFSGNFDGNQAVLNLESFKSDMKYTGIFGYLKNARVESVIAASPKTLTGGAVKGAFGAVVGAAEGASEIRACENRAALDTTLNLPTGGILGRSLTAADGAGVVLADCVNKGALTSNKSYLGGIVGQLSGNYGTITGCRNDGAITASNTYVGGIAGHTGEKLIALKDCTNTGSVTATGKNYVGGIAGYLNTARDAGTDLSGCVNTGAITGGNYVAGLFAYANNPLYRGIRRCVNEGSVTATGANAAGILAYALRGTIVEHSLNTGAVQTSSKTASTYVGGILGGMNTSFTSSSTEVQSVWAENCLNTGAISAGGSTAKVGAILPQYFEKNTGCYVQTENADAYADKDFFTVATEEQLASGEIAYLLNQGHGSEKAACWCQNGNLPYPIGTDAVYKLTIAASTHGKVEAGSVYAAKGAQVSLTVTPDAGYILRLITVTMEDSAKCDVTVTGGTASFQMPAGDVTVTASFVNQGDVAEKTCAVTFDSQGGSAVASVRVKGGQRVSKPADPEKTGYRFGGWYYDGALYDFNAAVVEDMTLTAQWTKEDEAVVTFLLNRPLTEQGSEAPAPQTVKIGEMLTEPAEPTWTSGSVSYRFTGWYTGRTDGRKWNFEQDTVAGDLTLYARWSSVDGFLSGTTPDVPYVIKTAEELRQLAKNVTDGTTYEGYYFSLGNDIDLNDLTDTWAAIGYHMHISTPTQWVSQYDGTMQPGSKAFEGSFDGGEYTITLQPDQLKPVFGCVGFNGKVENLKVKGVLTPNPTGDSTPKRQSFGGVVAYNYGVIENCHTDISTTDRDEPAFGSLMGGIAAASAGKVRNCTAKLVGTMKAGSQTYAGGIVGCMPAGLTENCTLLTGSYMNELSTSTVRTAGIVGGTGGGHNYEGNPLTIRNCRTESGALITGTLRNEKIAGIVGMPNSPTVVIENCVNGADIITESGAAAGIAANSKGVTIINCANTGTIEAKTADAAGIAFPYFSQSIGRLVNCYNVGTIKSGTGNANGLIGGSGAGATIANSYFYGKLEGNSRNAIVPTASAANVTITGTYYNTKDTEGDVFAPAGAAKAAAERFASGEIAYLLDGGDGARRNVWTQGSGHPVIGQPGVYKVISEVVGHSEAATITITPDSDYVVGSTELTVNVTVDDSDPDKTYVYTLVAADDAGSHDITGTGSLLMSSDTHIVARVQLSDEVYEEEPVQVPEDDPVTPGNGGKGDNPGGNTGENPGEGKGDNPGGNTGDNPGGSTGENTGSGENGNSTGNTGTGTTGTPSGEPRQDQTQTVTDDGRNEPSEPAEPVIPEPTEPEPEPEKPEDNNQPETPETPETPQEDENRLEEDPEIQETAKRTVWPVVILIVAVAAAALLSLLLLLKKKGDKTTAGK